MIEMDNKSLDIRNLFHKSLEVFPDLIFLISHDGMYLGYFGDEKNPFGLLEECIGKKIIDVMPKNIAKLLMGALKKTFETKHMQSLEFSLPIRNETHYFMSRFVYFSKQLLILLVRDITERKITEQDLKKSEEKFRNMVNNLDIGFFKVSFDGIYLEHNPEHNKILGINPLEDLAGSKTIDYWENPKDRQDYLRILMKNGFIKDFIVYAKKKSGEQIILQSNAHLIKNSNGEIIAIEGTFMDFTEKFYMEEKLRESRQKFRALFNNINDAVYIHDNGSQFIEVNNTACERLGYTREELLKLTPKDLIPQKYKIDIQANIKTLSEKGELLIESQHLTKDGDMFPVEISSRIFSFGGINSIISVTRDITERKKAEEKIANLAKFPSENPNPVLRANKEEILYINEAGQILFDIGTGDKVPILIKDTIREAIGEKITKAVEIELNNQTYSFVITPIVEENYVNVYGLDITERVISERALEKSEQKYKRLSNVLEQRVEERTTELKESEEKIQNLINNINDVLLEAEPSGILTFISPQIYNLIGYQSRELIGLNFKEFVHLEDSNLFNKKSAKALKTKKTESIECRIQHKKGYFVPISARWSFVEINNELKVFGLVSDNTERKKIDDMIKREIKQLKELDQIRSNLISRISHELKTPLISILNGSEFLLNDYNNKMSNEMGNIIKIIHQGGYRLKEMVDNLITAYEIETRQIRMITKGEDLNPIIKECVEEIVFQADKRKIFINLELSDDLCIDVDKSMIRKAILNLISNAIKNTLPTGNIFIKSIRHHNLIEIIIRDTGVGLTKKETSFLFKKFGKIERYGKGMDVDIEGPGLGLYLANELVKLHKGEISVKSKGRNKGSTFTIRLFLN